MSGLISRFIFISPSWDKQKDNINFATKVDVGTIQLAGMHGSVFCACMVMPAIGQRKCMYEKSHGPDIASDKDDENGGNAEESSDVAIIENQDDCKVQKLTFSSCKTVHRLLRWPDSVEY